MKITQRYDIDEDIGNYYTFEFHQYVTYYCIAKIWCEENIKRTEYDFNDFVGYIFIYNEIDAMAFKLRWL